MKFKMFFRKNKAIIILSGLVLLVATGFFIKITLENKPVSKPKEKKKEVKEEIPVKKLQILNENSTTRPIGIMIDNVRAAWPQAGINDAYLTYEIIVEGGLTRLFALFKDSTTSMIGPVRSLRHYYIDYQMENNSILAHFGHSPKALSDIGDLKTPSINGIFVGNVYWRDSSKTKAPHNAFTSMEKLTNYAKDKGLNKEVKDTLLKYSVDEISLGAKEEATSANTINIKYSYYTKITYQYDTLSKKYLKSTNGTETIDRNSNERLGVKNIIIIKVKNYDLPDTEDKDRQEIVNIGTGEGYYITNGFSLPIKYEKTSRAGKTKYTYLNGEEIVVNDGNTYIQIQPIEQSLTIE